MNSPLYGSDSAGEAVAASLARAAGAGPGLGEVLRAVAQESDSRRLAKQLQRLAAAVDQGRSLENALAAAAPNMPADILGLLHASQRTGNLPSTLAQWLDHRRASAAFWRDTILSLTYPLFAALVGFGVFLVYAWFVVPPMQQMLTEFGLKLAPSTRAVFWLADYGAGVATAVLVILVLIAVGIRLLGGSKAWSQTVAALPVLGDLWQWTNVAEMLRGLRLLIENQIPLPEALELAGQSVRDRQMGATCKTLARLVREGQPLSAAAETTTLPRSILPLLRSGQQQGTLAESLDLATRLLESRLRSTSQLVITLSGPFIFVLLAVLIGGMYVGLMMPLVSLIQGLS